MSDLSEEQWIFAVEDYIGGNVEGVETVDHMGLTVFLRSMYRQTESARAERVMAALPNAEDIRKMAVAINDAVARPESSDGRISLGAANTLRKIAAALEAHDA